MPARRRSRQRALQILFLWDVRKLPIEEAVQSFYSSLYCAEMEEDTGEDNALPIEPDPFMEALARGAAAEFAEIDALILQRAELAAGAHAERGPQHSAAGDLRDEADGHSAASGDRRSARTHPPLLRRGRGSVHQRRSGFGPETDVPDAAPELPSNER